MDEAEKKALFNSGVQQERKRILGYINRTLGMRFESFCSHRVVDPPMTLTELESSFAAMRATLDSLKIAVEHPELVKEPN